MKVAFSKKYNIKMRLIDVIIADVKKLERRHPPPEPDDL
jgi:hypothetical protein